MIKRVAVPAPAATPSGVAYLVGRLDRLLRRRMNEVLAGQGLSVQQYTVLAMLGARGQLSNAQLAERAFVTPQTANELVKSMESREWIERSPDPDHGRIIHLRLTRKGRSMLERGHAAAAAIEAMMLAGTSAADREYLHAALKACVQSLGAMLPPELSTSRSRKPR
jgi:DNA-binding MarR family transcriptional regulator